MKMFTEHWDRWCFIKITMPRSRQDSALCWCRKQHLNNAKTIFTQYTRRLPQHMYVYLFVLYFKTVFLCVAQAGLEFRDQPASSSTVLGLVKGMHHHHARLNNCMLSVTLWCFSFSTRVQHILSQLGKLAPPSHLSPGWPWASDPAVSFSSVLETKGRASWPMPSRQACYHPSYDPSPLL